MDVSAAALMASSSHSLPCLYRSRLMMLVLGALAVSTAAAQQSSPASGEEPGVFELGTVEVRARAPVQPDVLKLGGSLLTAARVDTVSDAVRHLPGVSLTVNGRNETMLNVRGFDSRQVPVYVDGIPLYVPYDGYADFDRFTAFDLAQVSVAKAGASLLYGPNTLGGAVNLVTRRPTQSFEGDVRLGLATGGGRKAALNLGGKQDLWYYQVGASLLESDHFRLPKGFKDFKRQPTDTGKYRSNADRKDRRLSFKLGLMPNASDEYAVGYVRQRGEKGNPVYTGTSTARNATRYWRWPYWDKDSVYVLTSTRLDAGNVLKTRLYHDTYKNGLDMYRNASYAAHDPTSSYKDMSLGLSATWENHAFAAHALRLAAHYKVDRHDDEGRRYRDVTTSLVAADDIALNDRQRLTLELSHDQRDAKEVYQWPTGKTDATNGLIRFGQILGASGDEAYVLVAQRTRFPTIKDRYSARLGRALPNPDLKPELAHHLELGVQGALWQGAQGQAAIFYSRVRDQIQTMTVNSSSCGGTTCNQEQNVGRTRNQGLELSLVQQLERQWALNLGYTLLHRTNLSDRSIQLTDTPRHRLLAGVQWQPQERWTLRADVEAEQGRKVQFSGSRQALALGGYGVVGLAARYQATRALDVDVGVSNLGDKWYQFSDGYPMPGRSYYLNVGYRF